MQPTPWARKHGAGFSRVIADRNHPIERLIQETVDSLAFVARDVDTDLGHHPDGLRSHGRRDRPGALNLEALARRGPQQTLRHL